jgi:hypothetical protein
MKRALLSALFIASAAIAGCGGQPQPQTFQTTSLHTVAGEATADDSGGTQLGGVGGAPCTGPYCGGGGGPCHGPGCGHGPVEKE